MSNQTWKSSRLEVTLVAALGLVSGFAIARLKFKLPKPSQGG